MSFSPVFNIPLTPATTGLTLTGTTTRTSIYSFVIKAGSMNLNSRLILVFSLSYNNSANNKTTEVEFGSTNILSFTENSILSRTLLKSVQNRNSLSSQVSYRLAEIATYGVSTSALVTMTENTANDITVTVYGTLTNTGDNITLNYLLPTIIVGTT